MVLGKGSSSPQRSGLTGRETLHAWFLEALLINWGAFEGNGNEKRNKVRQLAAPTSVNPHSQPVPETHAFLTPPSSDRLYQIYLNNSLLQPRRTAFRPTYHGKRRGFLLSSTLLTQLQKTRRSDSPAGRRNGAHGWRSSGRTRTS